MIQDASFKNIQKSTLLFFLVIDTLFSCLVIAPVVIGYWRGTWYLSDFYIFPQDLRTNLFVSGICGIFVQIIFTYCQDILKKNIGPKKQGPFYYVISRCYTYVYGLACINMWRGGWKALDYYCGTDTMQIIVPTVISFIVIVYMKTSRNLTAVPFIVAMDSSKNYFEVPTMFKLTRSSELSLYILDCFFSVFVVGTLVVFIWRGVWCLADVFLFPENEKYSALVSLAAGYSIIILVFGLQSPVKKMNEKLKGFWLLLFTDIHIFVSFIGTINLWRGFWILLNVYFLPENPIWSNWITHLGCFAILVFINCSNTVLVRGVYLDGEESIVFPPSYFSLFLENLRKKKLKTKETNQKKDSLNDKPEDVEKASKEDQENIVSEKKKKEKINVNNDTNEV